MRIVFLITFCVFFLEAFLHYNIGKTNGNSLISLHVPTWQETLKIAMIVGVFSYINAALIQVLD